MKTEELGQLPPGWDMKFDPRTGRYYFINHYTKSTSWEDPRVRYRQIGKPTSIASSSSKDKQFPPHIQETCSSSSSPKPGVNPPPSSASLHNPHDIPIQDLTNTSPAAQITSSVQPASSSGGMASSLSVPYAASPLPLSRLQGEESANASSPKSTRSQKENHPLGDISEAESSFTDPDIPVKAISSMFPTVEESHIRTLLKNNSYLETPTINQLRKDEKRIHRLRQANSNHNDNVMYLKSVFPTVEEYLLLDVLSNSDNNVQKAADRLVKMGYVKRDTPSAPRLHARKKEEERLAEKRTPLPKPPPIKTDQEKSELRKKMVETYEVKYDIPERILYMALESVLYDEDQANNLINSMIEDDLKRKKAKEAEKAKEKQKKKSPKPNRKSLELTTPSSPKKDFKKADKKSTRIGSLDDILKDSSMVTRGTSTQEDGHGRAKGPNPSLCKGPNDGLLLKDYVTWNGPDPAHAKGVNSGLASGPNEKLQLGSKSYLCNGNQKSLARGPQGLNKGSMYKEITKENETTRSS